MLAGSFASAHYGTPRTTRDIDIVIAPDQEQLRTLVGLLPPADYYVDLSAALQALQQRSLFNVVDMATGWKVDFILRKTRPFSQEEFRRRQAIELHGIRLFVATAEDVVISKLEWAKQSESQRQIDDVAGILRMRRESLDLAYIKDWVGKLGLTAEWDSACRSAGSRP